MNTDKNPFVAILLIDELFDTQISIEILRGVECGRKDHVEWIATASRGRGKLGSTCCSHFRVIHSIKLADKLVLIIWAEPGTARDAVSDANIGCYF